MSSIFDRFYETADKNVEYVAAGLCLAIAKNIELIIKDQGITYSELAKRLEVKKPYITRLLRGDENVTAKTLAKIAIALDAEVKTVLIPKAKCEVLDAKVRAFLSHEKKIKFDQPKRQDSSWILNFKGCNDEIYGTTTTSNADLEHVDARFA